MPQGEKRKRSVKPLAARKRNAILEAKRRVDRSQAVRGDKLSWREVTVSSRLDDAEGFYGLEELSDVEVIHDGNGKGVLFRQPILADATKGVTDVEEWSGFSGDENSEEQELSSASDKPEKPPTSTDKSSDKQKKPPPKQPASEELAKDTQFSLLGNDAPEPEIDMSAWDQLKLSDQMLYALSALKFGSPTQIQQTTIPLILEGKDVIGKAVTGSGKTLAFGIPIIETCLELHASRSRSNSTLHLDALILAPTRELAHQISKHLTAVCEGLDSPPKVVTVTGGLSVLKQRRQLQDADIVVGTPGRLWDVINDSNDLLERFKNVRYLVVDEADRLLSEGHFQELEDILDALDRKVVDEDREDHVEAQSATSRQTLVFSATFHKGLQQKLNSKQKDRNGHDRNNLISNKSSMEYLMHKLPFQEGEKPVFVDANPQSQMAEKLVETILECKAMEKDLYLYGFLLDDQKRRKTPLQQARNGQRMTGTARTLVFTNSVSVVKRLVSLLQRLELPDTTISPLHSNMPQKSRLRSLERFSASSESTKSLATSVLIATDVAARGLDIKGVTTVVHYHVPRTADTYVHRSGRTARVNESGNSVLLCSPDEVLGVSNLIARTHQHKQALSGKDMSKLIDRMYLSNGLLRQITRRVELAQKLVESTDSTAKVKNDDNWLRTAAEELGVDYDSDEFENASKHTRRGRGGEKERRQKRIANEETSRNKALQIKAQLKEELSNRLDLGEGMGTNFKYLAGGAVDVDQLLAERAQQ
ncbi:ATP-dependent RNA helicase [Lithohypha guttulata]|uniref:ATP-dependent RNA helicase n=1 Tax=Lithohypha guttulata TaxID=1690604 RepID=A0AAN7SX73_9EURO|nr:ATP-dependent RNA helicase [Lithohypha guttulata]